VDCVVQVVEYPVQSLECCRNLKLRNGTLRQFSRKQHFIVLAQTQWTRVQRLSPENKGVSPYIPLQAGYRSRKQSSTYIWLHVTPLAISSPQCSGTFMVQFFISLLCHPFPLPQYQNTACLFLFWSCSLLQHSPLWCSDPPRVKGHHLNLGGCIFIASLHGQLFFSLQWPFYGPDGLQYQGTQAGWRQTWSQDKTHCPAFHDICSQHCF
jgi:hypothetical protein